MTAPDGPRPEEQPAPGGRTQCPTCGGDGIVAQPRAAAFSDGPVGTVTVPKKCKPCDGRGWLPGFVIPV